MQRLKLFASGLTARYPEGDAPYQIATRLAEECGEVASEVCHFEGSGIKAAKHGEPSREAMAGEIKNVLSVAMKLAQYYEVEDLIDESIEQSIARLRGEGYLPPDDSSDEIMGIQ